MKKKNFIALATSIVLVLALVLSACAQEAAPTTPTTPAAPTTPTTPTTPQVVEKVVTVEPTYKVLNPTGVYIPVECKPCAPRLDSLAGKKILYYESDATNMYMPTLLAWLKKDYPTATFDIVYTEAYGRSTPDANDLTYQAEIRGVGW